MMSKCTLSVKCVNNGKYNVFTIADDEYIRPVIEAGYEWDGWMREDVNITYQVQKYLISVQTLDIMP